MFNPFQQPLRQPLPPLLQRLHALLDAHCEDTEEGIVIIEQDRRPAPDQPPLLPVIVVVPANATPRPGPQPPDFIAELVLDGGPGRQARYAKAGVREYWRLEPGPRLVVHTGAGLAESTTYEGDAPVRSLVLPKLALRASDLTPPAS